MTKKTNRDMRTRTLKGLHAAVKGDLRIRASLRWLVTEHLVLHRVNHSGRSRWRSHQMLTLFQRTLIAILAFGFLLVALVVAAKAPAQATTFAPAVQVPVNAVIAPGIVTTGDATVRVKPDG